MERTPRTGSTAFHGARWRGWLHAALPPLGVISSDFSHHSASSLRCVAQEGHEGGGKAAAVSPENDFLAHRRRNRPACS